MKRFVPILLAFLIFLAFEDSISYAQDDSYSASSSVTGGIGLIETPSARFAEDGEFTFGLSVEAPYNRLYASMQFFPWLEATLKYTEGEHRPYYKGSRQTWKDKGIDVKIRLLEEDGVIPELAIGALDFGGTGSYASEYIVASKRFNNIDLTLGLGVGRLGGSVHGGGQHIQNPFIWIDKDKEIRGSTDALGGALSLDRLGSGKYASFFGGIEYNTPIPNLSLQLEYDPSEWWYLINREKRINQSGHKFDLDSRLNIGLNYRYDISERDKVDFSLGLVRGNTLFANFAVHSNLNFSGKPRTIMGRETLKEPYLDPYPRLNQEWKKYVTDSIIWQMANMGFVTHQIIFDDNELIAEITQGRFLKPIFAIDLASRVLANNAPKNIEIITVINIERGIETFRASIPRETIVKSASKGPLDEKLLVFNQRENDELGSMAIDNDFLYPHFSWSIRPHLNGTLQHQIKFYFWQLEALFAAEYAIKKGLYINTKIGIDIVSNLDKYTWHVPDGELHNVRQDRRLYLTEGESGIRQLSLEYLLDLHPNVKARLAAGYLEWMYGGFGGETLYISDDRSWALGLEAWWVKQREFDQKFSFQDYETVTGFLTYYQDLPFYDMRLKIRAGKFLGTDTGAHIDISRRFATGARVGGIVALTNCDAVCTGEGSFNKWIYFQLPMNLFYQQSTTREKIGYSWAPLTKNSGTVVETGSGLYNLMTHANDEIDVNRLQPWSIKKIFSGFSRQPKERI